MSIKLNFVLVILLSLTSYLFSQETRIKSLTIADGLSQGAVSGILQDSRGFIWFATKDGLDRYDGIDFKHYKNIFADSSSLIDNKLNGLIEDSFGRLWISTQSNGIECFDPKTEIFHHIGFDFSGEPTKDLTFPKIFRTRNGKIWISTFKTLTEVNEHEDLAKLSFKKYVSGKNMPEVAPFTYPLISKNGEVYIYGQSEIQILDPVKDLWKEFHFQKKINTETPSFLIHNLNQNDKIWIYNEGRLRAWINSKLVNEYSIKLTFDHNFYKHKNYLYEDLKGNLWLLFRSQLLKITTKDLVEGNSNFKVVIESSCENMYVDGNSHLWVGTNGYGVRMLNLDQKNFEHWLPGLSPMSIDKFIENTYIINSYITISEDGEVLPQRFDGRSVANEHASFVLEDTHNYRNLKVKRKSKDQIISIPYLSEAIPFLDKNSNYWIVFENSRIGVLWQTKETLEYYSFIDIWNDETPCLVNSVYEDKEEDLWLSSNKGLVQISKNKNSNDLTFKKWTREEQGSLNSNSILCVMDDPLDPQQYLWVGTKGGGLNKFEKLTGKCTYFTFDNGLANNVVYGILPDDYGNLWLSTNYGLSQFNIKNSHFRNFTAETDGLQDNEFNTSSFQKLKDGRLAFGGVNGISVFHPKNLIADTAFANIVFTGLKLNNKSIKNGDETNVLQKPIDLTTKVNLNHDQNFISISFASIASKAMGDISHYYKLENIDHDWVFAGKKNEVSYSNLGPGTYSFLVSNVAQNGLRNPNPKELTFVISNPWWSTWLAYFIYCTLFCSLVYSFFSFRLKRARLQQELLFKEKQTEQLKSLDELKSKFFSNITHEFRTPLTLLIEPARLLLKKEDSEVRQKSGIIFNNANQLLLLVNQLLDISKLEEDKMKIESFEGDILIVIKEIFSYFKPLTTTRGQSLLFETNLADLIVETDKQIIEKVLYNLLSNAFKFTPENGEIILKVNTVNEHHWELIVQDNGIGISSENLNKIFDRFYQSDDSNTRKYEGSGIGLALVKEMVDLMGGKIEVQSKINEGTKVTITFSKSLNTNVDIIKDSEESNTNELIKNIVQQQILEEESDNKPVIDKNEHFGSILVVEDNFEMSNFIISILGENGFTSLKAVNGEEGIELALKHIPDLILADVMMPVMDGMAMVDGLKKNKITSHIPIVLLTAKTSLNSKLVCYRKGADAYLTKPFNSEELMVRIRQLLTNRKVLQLKYLSNEFKTEPQVNQIPIHGDINISSIDMEWIKNLEIIIKKKILVDAFTMDELSSEMFMSRTQFFTKVKSLTGMTPAVLVKNIRLDLAYQMVIDQPQSSFSEISTALGMSDAKYFKKLFKEKFGQNPSSLKPFKKD